LKAYDNVGIKEQDERGEKALVAQKAKAEGRARGKAEARGLTACPRATDS